MGIFTRRKILYLLFGLSWVILLLTTSIVFLLDQNQKAHVAYKEEIEASSSNLIKEVNTIVELLNEDSVTGERTENEGLINNLKDQLEESKQVKINSSKEFYLINNLFLELVEESELFLNKVETEESNVDKEIKVISELSSEIEFLLNL